MNRYVVRLLAAVGVTVPERRSASFGGGPRIVYIDRGDGAELARLTRKTFDAAGEKHFLWQQSGRRCEWYVAPGQRCQATFPEVRHMQADHFYPRKGKTPGVTDLSNGAALCASCNGKKSTSQPPRWMRVQIIQDRAMLAQQAKGETQ